MLRRIVRKGLRVANKWLSEDQDMRVPEDAETAYPWLNALQLRIARELPTVDRSYLWVRCRELGWHRI